MTLEERPGIAFSADHLAMRFAGLVKSADESEPGEREFCLAALSDILDEYNARMDEIDRLREQNRLLREALEWIANRYRDDSEDARGIALDTLNRMEQR